MLAIKIFVPEGGVGKIFRRRGQYGPKSDSVWTLRQQVKRAKEKKKKRALFELLKLVCLAERYLLQQHSQAKMGDFQGK